MFNGPRADPLAAALAVILGRKLSNLTLRAC